MAPILGIWASSKATTAADTGAMFPLQVITVGPAGASSVSFTNIPGTYTHLQIRAIARTTRANQEDNVQIRFNSDSAGNYASHVLYGDGATAGAFSDGSSISFNTRSVVAAASSTASTFGATVIDILDYANTNKYKTARALSGYDANGNGQVRLVSGLWMSTSAITSITLLSANSADLVANSQFALYGIKGA